MKFKLFERLRDNDDGNNSTSTGAPNPGLGQDSMDSGPELSGGSLERTVENMFDQGYSEEEIRNELQGQYDGQEITQAINNTVANNATPGSEGPDPMTAYQSNDEEDAVSPMDEGFDSEQEGEEMEGNMQGTNQNQMQHQNQGMQNQQIQQNQPPPQQPIQTQGNQDEQAPQGTVNPETEELIETIIAENFQRVKKEFENVYEELETVEDAVEDLEKRVHDLEVRDDEDQEQFIQKVDEMEDHIDDYQSRIGGLEKAFQQVLPNLVDNVRDLTSLVQEMKQEKGIQTDTTVNSEEVEEMNQELEDW